MVTTNPNHYFSKLKATTETISRKKIDNAARVDPNSKLGRYLLVNPELEALVFVKKFDFQRTLITRYRTGTDNSEIEKDRRIPNSNREDHICSFSMGIITIKPILMEGHLL